MSPGSGGRSARHSGPPSGALAGAPPDGPRGAPVEPPPSAYVFDLRSTVAADDLVAVGADLRPGTLLAAYRAGLFPMGLGRSGRGPIGWWSPDPRGVLPLDGLRVSRSLRRSLSRFELRVDAAFEDVVAGCADPSRPGRWITPAVATAYQTLHRLGWAHSVECWRDGELVGGLYGVAVGGLFAGESMFHRVTDASKVALVGLVEILRADADRRRLLDVQWRTDHLAGLGVVEIPRHEYLARLQRALAAPEPLFPAPDAGAAASARRPDGPAGQGHAAGDVPGARHGVTR